MNPRESLLNYSTSIAAEKTISEIMQILAAKGASAIMMEYSLGTVSALSFRMPFGEQCLAFKLPANVEAIFKILNRDSRVTRSLKTMEQACRVAWRIQKTWLEAQLALIAAEQASLDQLFLHCAMRKDGATIYDAIKSGGLEVGLALEDRK